jgi:hypothetical protein
MVAMVALQGALSRAIADSSAVGKGGNNRHHNYRYATAEQIFEEGRAALARHGLSVTSHAPRLARAHDGSLVVIKAEIERTRNGKRVVEPYQSLLGLFRHAVRHEAGGVLDLEETEWPVCPDAGRPIDKALAGTRTTVLSYTIRDLLMIPRVDHENDDDPHGDTDSDRRTGGGRQDDEERDEAPQSESEAADKEALRQLCEAQDLVREAAATARKTGADPATVAAWLERVAGITLVADGKLRLLALAASKEAVARVLGAPRTPEGYLELFGDEQPASAPAPAPETAAGGGASNTEQLASPEAPAPAPAPAPPPPAPTSTPPAPPAAEASVVAEEAHVVARKIRTRVTAALARGMRPESLAEAFRKRGIPESVICSDGALRLEGLTTAELLDIEARLGANSSSEAAR